MIRQHSSGPGGAHNGWFRPAILMAAADSGGGGSGGGQGGAGGDGAGAGGAGGGQAGDGGGAGSGAAGGGSGGEDMQTLMNRVLSAREKANAGKIAQQVKDAVAAAIGGDVIGNAVKAALEAAGVKPPQPGGQGGDGGQQGAAGRSAEYDAKFKELQQIATNAEKLANEERQKREAMDLRVQRDEERGALIGVLNGGKDGRSLVRAEMLDDVAEILAKRVVRDPDNPSVILWKGDNWNNRDGADNSLNYEKLEAGIKKWSETPKGKAYAPPTGATGGGTGRANSGGHGRQRGDEIADDAQVAQLIMRPVGR